MVRPRHFEFKRPENRHANTIPVAVWSEVNGHLRENCSREKLVNLIGTHVLNEASNREKQDLKCRCNKLSRRNC